MNLNPSYRTRRVQPMSVPLALAWSHAGVAYRVTPWPEVRFERRYGEDWVEISPTEEALASAAQTCEIGRAHV